MKNPTSLTHQVTYEQAMELIEYLYGMFCEIRGDGDKIRGYHNGEHVVNYTSEYGYIMTSQDFVEQIRRDQGW